MATRVGRGLVVEFVWHHPIARPRKPRYPVLDAKTS